MLKLTRTYGIGVLLVVAPLLAAVYGIATGDFFFDDEGRGITLLIIFGFGMFSIMCLYAATKMDVSKNAKGVGKEAKEAQKHNANGAKEGFVHP